MIKSYSRKRFISLTHTTLLSGCVSLPENLAANGRAWK